MNSTRSARIFLRNVRIRDILSLFEKSGYICMLGKNIDTTIFYTLFTLIGDLISRDETENPCLESEIMNFHGITRNREIFRSDGVDTLFH